jgi:hypothetical protein
LAIRQANCPACWATQVAEGVGGAAGEMNAAAAELDEEEQVQALESDRLDGEEVGSQDRVAVLTDELAPGRPSTQRCQREAVAPEGAADSWEQRTPSWSSSPWMRR